MTDAFLIAGTNHVVEAGATLTGAGPARMGVEQLRSPRVADTWRSTGASPVQIGGSFAGTRSCSFAAFFARRDGLLLAATDTLRLRLYASAAPVYDSTAAACDMGWRGCWARRFAAVAADAWTLDIGFAGAYAQLGLGWICDPLDAGRSVRFGWVRDWTDDGVNQIARGAGTRYAGASATRPQLQMQVHLDDDAAEAFEQIRAAAGSTGQVLVSTHPDSNPNNRTIAGRLVGTAPLLQEAVASPDLNALALNIEGDN